MDRKKLSMLVISIVVTVALLGCAPKKEVNPGPPPPADNRFDLIVVGGEPEGVAAAVSASRNGLTVLLIEDDEALGGLMTLGKLNFIDMNHGRDGTLLTQGIFKEFHDRVGGTAFDVEEAKAVFKDMVDKQRSVVLKLNTKFLEPIKDGGTLTGVRVEEAGQVKEYYGQRLVDATADADLAAAGGVPYTFAGEDIGEKDRQMGVTLVFELSNVDWNKVVKYLKNDGNDGTGADSKSAWGYTDEGFSYEPQDPLMRLRGFNIARQDNGDVLINALIIFGVDVLDPESKAAGIARGREELQHILPYVRENFVGFEEARLVGTAEQLYVRESRHIIGEYQLTIDDVLENRDQWDKIAVGSYPVDVQPTATQRWGTVIGNPDRYAVPFRSLVPLEVENLLVVGRSASYKSLAAGSARVIPLGMCEGEAAGVAAAYSINNELSFRDMTKSREAIEAVQEKLIAQGAYLKSFAIKEPNTEHWAYDGVRVIRGLGLLDGGYNNDYRLEEPLGKWRFQNLINKTLEKAGRQSEEYIEVSDPPTNEEILKGIAWGLGYRTDSYAEAQEILAEKGVLTEKLRPYFAERDKQPQAAEVTVLAANVYKYFRGRK
ncbi:MAG: FAD-dependent oxidoreductase [Peptococcaceae bacterium]